MSLQWEHTQLAMFGSTEDSPDGDEWATPWGFFRKLDAEFGFTLDGCASAENSKCDRFFTKDQNGLAQDWGTDVVFLNPPYGRKIGEWMAKARDAAAHGATVVCLVHARTDTDWFHRHVLNIADDVRFIKGRINFVHSSNKTDRAPFPSVVVVYRPKAQGGR